MTEFMTRKHGWGGMGVIVGGALQRILGWIHRELSFCEKKMQETPSSLSRAGNSVGTQEQ